MLNILIDPSNERKIADFRHLGFRDVMVLGRHDYAQAHPPLEAHTHGDMFEIVLLDEGEQPYVVEGDEFTLKGGDVLVTLPNELHGSGREVVRRGRLYWMLVRVPKARERFLELSPSEGQELTKTLLTLPSRHFRGRPGLKNHLENIFEVHDRTVGSLRTTRLKSWMLRFLLDVVDDAHQLGRSSISSSISETKSYIDRHFSEESLPLEELAKRTGLSCSRFKARFRSEVGIAPGHYIIMCKIDRAKELLRQSNLPMTEIGFRLGFSSSQYFATVFRRHTALTPTAFRKAERQNRREPS